MKVLIMGLPGSGKTTLAKNIVDNTSLDIAWFNADVVRKKFDDWDFSSEGRSRQAARMRDLADAHTISICDFVCPNRETLDTFEKNKPADLIVWLDTIKSSRFEDTNRMFEPPTRYDVRIKTWSDDWGKILARYIELGQKPPVWNNRAPTVQMLGRWQPWHEGHQALFERLLERTGQVCIQIRDCQGWNDSNPFDVEDVESNIHRALETKYHGRYCVQVVPNIVHIGYGRGVGYTIEQEVFDQQTHSISATDIRKSMGLR